MPYDMKNIYRTPKDDKRLLWACSHVNASVPKYEAQIGILLLLFCFGMSSSPPGAAMRECAKTGGAATKLVRHRSAHDPSLLAGVPAHG